MNNIEVSLNMLLGITLTGNTEVDAYLARLREQLQNISKISLPKVLQQAGITTIQGNPLSDKALNNLYNGLQGRDTAGSTYPMGNAAFVVPPVTTPSPKLLTELGQKTQNVTTQFWGMWQASWAVRAITTDLFGYANSGMQKIREVSQAIIGGMYVHQMLLKSLTESYTKHFAITGAGYAMQQAMEETHKILAAERLAGDIEGAKKSEESLAKQEAGYAAAAKSAAKPAGMISWGVAAVAIGVGLYQTYAAISQEVNKAKEDIHNLAESMTSLTSATTGTKLAFSSIDDLIAKISKDVPSMASSLQGIVDPLDRVAAATALIYQLDTAKRLPSFNPFAKLIADMEEANIQAALFEKFLSEGQLQFLSEGQIDIASYALFAAYQQQQSAQNIVSGTGISPKEIQEESWYNYMLGLKNSLIKDESKDYDYLTSKVQEYGTRLFFTIWLDDNKNALTDVQITKIKQLTDAYSELTDAENKNDMGRLAGVLSSQLSASGVKDPDMLMTQLKKYLQNDYDIINAAKAQGLSTSTPMTLLEFDKKMYDDYSAAAKNDAQYTQQASSWKQKLISDLKTEIATQSAVLVGQKAYGDAWEQTQVKIADAKNELAALLAIQEKLNSTWFNIPTSIIRPTESQLTQATVYLKPNIYVTASSKKEIGDAIAVAMNDKDAWSNIVLPRGNVGG